MVEIKPTQQEEFLAVSKYCKGLGVDIGCGTNRFSPEVLALDHYPHSGPNANDMVVDCRKLPFKDGVLDFVFSSHCLEDFDPKEIRDVFFEWLRVIKDGGYMVLLLPDMEGGRYAKAGEPNGNPSHKVDVGVKFMEKLIEGVPVKVVQKDTIDHKRFFTFDFVIKKLEVTLD